MNLKPYFSNHFRCDDCQREFYRTTAYSPNPALNETYCENCVVEENPKKQSKKKDFGLPPTETTENLHSLEIDKRTLRKTGRIHQFNTSVSEEWLAKLKQVAYEERLNYNQVLEKALECYTKHLKKAKK
jgi:hypothetical protein